MKLNLACSQCDFKAQSPEEFVDHLLVSGHVLGDGVVGTDGAGLKEMIEAMRVIQTNPEGLDELPEGMEIREFTMADLEADPDIPEAEKAKIREFMKQAPKGEGGG